MADEHRLPLPTGLVIPVILLLLLTAAVSGAQDSGPGIQITWPNEGETLYAGPTSLLFKAPVKGRIGPNVDNPAAVDVHLDVFRGDEQIGHSLHTTPAADGTFAFELTVNPQGTREEFEIAFSDCGTYCHSEGQMALQPGHIRLEVTATGADGEQSVAIRHITVDLSEYASVPVQVLSDGEPVTGVTVSAATRVYLWRARYGSGVTGEDGRADVSVEALSQAPTAYHFQVDRTLVDGVLYEGTKTAQIVLPPGADSAPLLTLTAKGRRGAISGQLEGNEVATVHAIRISDGSSIETQSAADGAFSFQDIPIDRYRLTAGGSAVAVDLIAEPEADVSLPPASEPAPVAVLVQDEKGSSLPFAWATAEGESEMVQSHNGAIRLANVDAGTSLMVHAPGYYSQAHVAGDLPIRVGLAPRPETELMAWGNGRLVLPAGSRINLDGRTIALEQGWLWGEGGGAEPFRLETPAATIEITTGNFALEVLSGDRAWLYLFEGEAQARRHDADPVSVKGGEMVNLWREDGLRPVPYDPVSVSVLAPEAAPAWMPAAWEPELRAQLRDRLARAGIGIAQVITFVTYTFALLAALASPFLAAYVWRRWRRAANERASSRETSSGRV